MGSILNSLLSFLKKTFLDALMIVQSREGFKSLYRVSLYQNAGYLMLNSAVGAILGFVFWMVAARFYPSSAVGIASALIASMGLLNSLSFLGLNIGLIRFLPEAKDKRGMINSCFTIVGICSMVLALIFIVGTPLWSPVLSFLSQNTKFFLSFIIFTTVTSLFQIQGQTFIAFRSAKFTFAQQIIWRGLKIALIVMLISYGILGIFSAWGIATLIAVLIGNLFFLRKVQPGYFPLPSIKKKVINEIAHFSASNYSAEVMGNAPIYILPLMIVNILGAEPSAYFRIAYGIGSVLFIIPIAISFSLFAEGSHEPEKLRANVIKAIKFMFLLLIPAIVLILLLGDKILLLFGSEYSENALRLLWILALASIPFAINDLYVTINRVEFKVKPVIYTYLGAMVSVIGGSYILMSRVGLIGIGLGWILGQGAVAIPISMLIIRWLRSNKEVKPWQKQH